MHAPWSPQLPKCLFRYFFCFSLIPFSTAQFLFAAAAFFLLFTSLFIFHSLFLFYIHASLSNASFHKLLEAPSGLVAFAFFLLNASVFLRGTQLLFHYLPSSGDYFVSLTVVSTVPTNSRCRRTYLPTPCGSLAVSHFPSSHSLFTCVVPSRFSS
ncbi:hypothetical protein BX661DRAFT_8459 [Kickxella alabastrina]|uniref:uncharacterized protein n=1 Tax=Kickxella alabastrina TaxID=61397 RepID=UPI00221F59E1|nr:uncharacterized protein BX661DRAFT_8459 [Kickxella alabastrina]KAI7834923.1 hypothetical protein BX661DRAFT_8459 [Kickxella alabastrina]